MKSEPPMRGVLIASIAFVSASAVANDSGVLTMPAGSMQYIEISGNWADPGLCPGGGGACGGDAANGTEVLNAAGNLVQPCRLPANVFASGGSTANTMRIRHVANGVDTVFHRNSMVDVYTIHGPPGTEGQPVQFTLTCPIEGQLSVGRASGTSGSFLGGSAMLFHIGTWNPATSNINEQLRVANDGLSQGVGLFGITNFGAAQPSFAVNYSETRTLTRTVGTPFEIAYQMDVFGFNGIATGRDGDGELIARIRFELPAGFSITSVRGWTDPDAPSCPGDTNGDGSLNFFDVATYLSLFNNQNPAADLAPPSGVFNFFDLAAYLALYNAGCP